MRFNGNTVCVECTEYAPAAGKSTIKVTAEKPFTLKVKTDTAREETVIEVPGGEHTYCV